MLVDTLFGTKLGMTQIYNDTGISIPVTAIQVGPCVVIQRKTTENDGYTAIQLGYRDKKEKASNRPELGHFKKCGATPKRLVQEVRVNEASVAELKEGASIQLKDVFKVGDIVDVSGTTKGRGFAGVFKRHGFHGPASITHGTHEYKRHGGSIGNRTSPGRTFKNLRMPGHYGNVQMTIQNLKIVQLIEDDHVIFVKGAVPGATHGILKIRHAVKKSAHV